MRDARAKMGRHAQTDREIVQTQSLSSYTWSLDLLKISVVTPTTVSNFKKGHI